MAEQDIDSLITPQTNGFNRENAAKSAMRKSGSLNNRHKTNSNHRRASIGSYRAGGNSTMNSTEKLDSPNNSQHAVPNYLRASTGSCHDFCKYGRKHASEEKARLPFMKRLTKPESDKQSSSMEIVVEHKLSPDVKFHSPKCKPSVEAEVHSPNKKASSSVKTGTRKHKPSITTKAPSVDPPEIIKREILLPSKTVQVKQERDTSTDDKISRNGKKTNNLSKKHSPSMQLKPLKVKPSSSPSDTSDGVHLEGKKSKQSSVVKTGRKMAAPKLSEGKKVGSITASSSPKISLSRNLSLKSRKAGSSKPVSTLKDQNRVQKTETKISKDEKVPEKTLHVIKTETGINLSEFFPNADVISLPPQSPSSPKSLSNEKPSSASPKVEEDEEVVEEEEEIEYTDGELDDFDSEYDTDEDIDATETAEDNQKKTRTQGTVVSEERDGAPSKLKFRRGKVVDLQSDHSTPRRLRFRRGRVVGEGQNGKGDLKRRVFKKVGSNDDKNGADPSSEKVVLKHQDAKGKKDAQGLFNNVIEETASKLVESRKSKVKALVGAFETVISLQESKPASQTDT